jgi:hypothetical protein
MTTTYDTEPNTHTIAAQTVATAWASSPFGQSEDEVGYGFAIPAEPINQLDAVETRSLVKHAVIATALASGICAGAAIGLMLGGPFTTQPVVMVPGLDISPHHVEVVSPSSLAPTPKAAVPVQEMAPVAVAPTSTVAPPTANQPSTAAVAAPPVAPPGETTAVVDIPIPVYAPLPQGSAQQEPEPPQSPDPDPEPPKPPVLDIPNFKPPEVSKPQTEQDLPTLLPKPSRTAILKPQLDPQEPQLDSRFGPIGPKKKPTTKRTTLAGL